MHVEGSQGIADGTRGVCHFGAKDAFPPGFHGFFVDYRLLAGHDFFLRRAEIEDDHQPVQRLFPGDADLAIDLDLGAVANCFGFQNLDVRPSPRARQGPEVPKRPLISEPSVVRVK